ncbi:MAG: DUF6775 family putative metallopeptidase, partial [Armatimonadota bacterium]
MHALKAAYLYHSSPSPTLDPGAIRAYLDELLPGVEIHLRGAYEDALGGVDPATLAAAIIEGIAAPTDPVNLAGVEPVIYNAVHLAAAMAKVIPRDEARLDCLHIDLSHRLMGTWDERDNRYHLRTVLCFQPSIVSIPGLVEAPARPRKYAIMRMQFEALRMPDAIAELDEEYAGSFLTHGDERLTEVAKGYVMQAVFHRLTGEA